MRFFLDDMEVLFPYDYIYPEQYAYMRQLKNALHEGHCLLEMPTGTGKTVTLLSLILSYQHKYTTAGKLIYCTRTVQEMDKAVEELKRVVEYRIQILAGDDSESRAGQLLGVCLSARRNMCIHPEVSKYDNANKVDAKCRNLTATFVREEKSNDSSIEVCDFYEGYQRGMSDSCLTGIYALDDMKELGLKMGWCPYFVARHLINLANVVVYNYQVLPKPNKHNKQNNQNNPNPQIRNLTIASTCWTRKYLD